MAASDPVMQQVAYALEGMTSQMAELKEALLAILQVSQAIVENQDGHTEMLREILEAGAIKKPKSDLPKALEKLAGVVSENNSHMEDLLEVMEAMPASIERVVLLAVEQGVTNAVNLGEIKTD